MCKRNILAQEKYGVVTTCENCGVMDLTFGNFSLQVSEEDFRIYLDVINTFRQKHVNRKSDYCRNIKISTLLENLQLVFSYKELNELNDLMSTALLILDSERLMS